MRTVPMIEMAAPDPIRASWKISQVLQRYPALLDVLVDAAPAFQKLRNPLLRRVQSRLVTVEQAARIAGVEPAALVQTLNGHLGLDTAYDDAIPTGGEQGQDMSLPPIWAGAAEVAVTLDVRGFQERDEEPFGAIMDAARRVPAGKVLALRNTFEPIPLYDILGMRGFEHWARQRGDDDWEIYFYNTGTSHARQTRRQERTQPVAGDTTPLDWDAPNATITIDVSELVPPEPMVRILETLVDLPPGNRLLVHHVRRPIHLYPQLDTLGYRHETREPEPGHVEVLIEKPVAPTGDWP